MMAASNYTALLAIFFISFVTSVAAETLHIVTDSTSCQDTATESDDVRCATLSQFALNLSSFTTSNVTTITLTMDPGIHNLSSTLFFSSVSMVELLGPPEDTMSITCNTTSPAFVFEDISSVHIVGMIFRGCGEISVSSVEEFIVQDCDFFAKGFEEAGLIVSETNAHIMNSQFSMYSSGALRVVDDSELIISGCTFSQNQADISAELVNSTLSSIGITQPRTEYEPSVYNLILMSLNQSSHLTGGAISLHNSTMLIANTMLEYNTALLGGALYIENSSLTISNGSALIGNLAFSGGALFAVGSSITITDGRYMDNAAVHNGSGGALYVGLLTVCHIESADFERNTASYGGALYIYSFADVIVPLYTNYFSRGAGITLTTDNSVTVDNCTLLNNTAGYGGALYTEQSNLIISNSTINHNTATLRGSALYSRPFSNIIINGSSLNKNTGILGAIYFNRTSLQFINSKMSGNTYGYGYALESEIEFFGENTISDNCGSFAIILSNMTIRGQTLFVNNNMPNECRVDLGIETIDLSSGVVTSFISNVFVFGKVNFSSNVAEYGGAILSWESRLHIWRGEIIFQDNYASEEGGAIYVYESNLEFRQAQCLFDGNFAEESGGAMHLVSSIVNIFRNSTVVFAENEAKLGGAILLELGSKLSISKTNARDIINVSFSQNRADYGGALYVTDDTNSGTCAASSRSTALARSLSNLITSSECFFQTLAIYAFSSVPNPLIKHIHFSKNLANHTGNSLYGGLLDRCQPSIFSEFSILHLNKEVSGTKYILETTNIQGEDISSGPVRLCFCENGTPNCNYVPTDPWVVTKGVPAILPIVAVDQFNHTVETEILSFFSSKSAKNRLSSHSVQTTYGNCSDLQFKIQSAAETENLTLFANGSCGSIGISATMIEIEFVSCVCPVGFKEAENDSLVCRCECGKELIENLGGENQCVIAQFENDKDNFLQRDSNFWIGTLNDSAPYHNECLAFFRYCPFDYCFRPESVHIEFNLNTSQITDSDIQCNGNRTGALCGSCRDGFSLALGSSKCLPNSTCTNSYVALVLAFALAGVVLVAFIMFFNLTVAVGTMNGLIFYANIIITTRTIISLPNSGIAVNPLTIFIAWLNLDLGIETCFHQGMDGLTKVGWQFVFPLYVLLLVVLVIFLCERSQRFANFVSGRNAVATLATLILFSYLKFLRIIVDAFIPAKVYLICPDGGEYSQRRWYYDGNKYFDPGHIVLFLAALVVLLLGVAYTLILLSGQWFAKLSKCPGLKWLCGQKLNHFLEPYSAPYIPKHRYWTGLLLLARILSCIFSTIATDRGVPQGNLFSITMIATALLLWKLVVGGRIYQNLLVDILESFFLVLLIVYGDAAQFVLSYSDVLQPLALFYTLTTIALIVFILILLYHGYIYVLLPTSAGEKFNMWITKKLDDGKDWLKETSFWKRFRSAEPETAEFEEEDSPFSRGQQSFNFLQASHSFKKRSQLKTKQQPVTYSTVEIVPETPLSEELGHYSKGIAKLRNHKEKYDCSGQEEFELVPILLEESNNDEIENDNSASVDLKCFKKLGGSNIKVVEDTTCDGLNSQPESAEVKKDGEGVKLIVQENSMPAELVLEECRKSENHEFATSYELITKD